ncbi:replication restart helicase PriA [Laedolimicola intestinihominis]|uniref:Replication restart protein PriA n=1 Tax=Laedolimicola intestinihominis TaxID=3133166 RepID=A0ABV1FF72_9FIRM
MKFANIIVDISLEKLDRTFQYRVPEELQGILKEGMQVRIPFGNGGRTLTGYVLELTDTCEWDEKKLKPILGLAEKGIRLEGQLIALAAWMRRTYGSTMNQALKTVLPVKKSVQEKISRKVRLAVTREEAEAALAEMERKHQTARVRIIKALLEQTVQDMDYAAAQKELGLTAATARKLMELGLIRIESDTIFRNPVRPSEVQAHPFTLYPAQQAIVEDVAARAAAGDLRPSLIHGVTGSGKTEVYMELIAAVLEQGKEAVVLIPEIALTFQTVLRFYRRFGDQVSIIHSKLSAGERYDQFERARRGEVKVMIGPRSALFTPFPRLGVIVIDEEHEGSYKSENAPRYHAREAAIERARMCGAFVVLGSATPSVDSYERTKEGLYRLYELPLRVENRAMPETEVVDLREELRMGNRSIFSARLKELMEDRLRKGEQIMLFLNRRGYAGFVSCRACGHVIKCPHCDVSLSLHHGGRMVCHYCGYQTVQPKKCPSCGSAYIGAFRAGTQQVAEAAAKTFPGARILRMDFDTTRQKGGYERILEAFSKKQADILVGTQMIVKGHDFPGVTLVGALAADLSLYAGDYRAAERTFQLLVQAAGRAGRGTTPGTAVIQTYSPDHYSIETAADQDYKAFFEKEMAFRRMMNYPPAAHLMALYLMSEDEEALNRGAVRLKALAMSHTRQEIALIGPSDAGLSKLKDVYRKVLYLKCTEMNYLTEWKGWLEAVLPKEKQLSTFNIQFDMDPVNPF